MNEESNYYPSMGLSTPEEFKAKLRQAERWNVIALVLISAQAALIVTLGVLTGSVSGGLLAVLGVGVSALLARASYSSGLLARLFWMVGVAIAQDKTLSDLANQRAELNQDITFLNRQLAILRKRQSVSHLGVSADSESKAARLVSNIALIEEAAAEFLRYSDSRAVAPEGVATRRSFFQLRSDLLARGAWSSDDVVKFDKALKVRNAIVHGDNRKDSESLDEAISATDELLRAILQASAR